MSQVLVTVPSRVLLEQVAEEMPGFCKVGMGYNDKIDWESRGFVAVTDSVQLLNKLEFEAAFIDEAHHPVPKGMPSCKDLFKFSATHKEEADFRYSLGEAIEQGVLCDYDFTVPVTTEGHPYICLANLLLSQAGRFRRVLAYCNSIAEARRFRSVLESLGLAAWHINGDTNRKERERVMRQFSSELAKPVHVLVTVQVLGEGVNIPNADTCMFVEPRSSYVSIIQAVGRVLRLHPSKPLAHVVLPAVAVQGPTLAASSMQPSPVNSGSSHNAPRAAITEVSPYSSIHECPEDIGTEVAPQSQIRSSPPASPSTEAADGQAATSKRAGAVAGGRERTQPASVVDGTRHRSKSPQASSEEEAGELLGPAPQPSTTDKDGTAALAASLDMEPGSVQDAGLHSRVGTTRQSAVSGASDSVLHAWNPGLVEANGTGPVTPVVRRSSNEHPSASMASMAALESGPVSGPARSLAAGAATSQQTSFLQAASQESSQTEVSSVEATTRDHGSGSSTGPPKPGPTSRLSARVTGDAGFLGRSLSEQLDRFLCAISRSDSRFAGKDVGHVQSCLWVTDCRLSREVSLHPLVRSMQYQLAEILRQRDPWELRLQAVEQFAREHGRLPRQKAMLPEEKVLGVWLHNVGSAHKRHMLTAARMQKLLNSSCDSLRARTARWLDPSTDFERRLAELQQFVQEHDRLPHRESSAFGERSLSMWLRRVGYLLKKHRLSATNLQKLLRSSSSIIRAHAEELLDPNRQTAFDRLVEEVQRFVQEHNRMPRKTKTSSAGERELSENLAQLVRPTLRPGTRMKRLQLLAKLSPIIANWANSRQARKPRIRLGPWNTSFRRLLDFVTTNQRLPRRKNHRENSLYTWLLKQRHRAAGLPSELQEALVDSHPMIAAYFHISV